MSFAEFLASPLAVAHQQIKILRPDSRGILVPHNTIYGSKCFRSRRAVPIPSDALLIPPHGRQHSTPRHGTHSLPPSAGRSAIHNIYLDAEH